jgi:membrane-associated phospholipid phosphatase
MIQSIEHGKMKQLLAAVTTATIFVAGAAPAQTPDTLSTNRSLFVAGDAVLMGGFVAATVAAAPLDRWMTRSMQDEARQANRFFQRTATGARFWGNPGALIAAGGIYLAGTASGNRRVQDLGLHAGGSVVIANLITGGMKTVLGRARPYVDSANARNFHLMRGVHDRDYRSFPSGHSTAAFAFASLVTAETSHWWPDARWPVGAVTYGVATLTAVSRVYNYKHWTSDVVAGAAIGTLTGIKVFRYQHSHPDNRIDNFFLRAGMQSTGGKWSVIFAAAPR